MVALIVGFAFAVAKAIDSTEAEAEQELIAINALEERDRAITAEAARKQAETSRNEAVTEAAKSAQVARVLKDMMAAAEPQVALGRDASLLLDIVNGRAERLSLDLKDYPLVEPELRQTLSEIYFGLASNKAAETARKHAAKTASEITRRGFGEPGKAMTGSWVACLYADLLLKEAERNWEESGRRR